MASKRHVKTMVFCPVKQKMVDKGTEQRLDANGAPMVIPPLKPFISPVTGEEITCREQLRRHNREHGITDSRDYSRAYLEERRKERLDAQAREGRADRIRTIQRAMRRS
jgi:hypothetical protein